MKHVYLLLNALVCLFVVPTLLLAEDIAEATDKKAAEVRELKIGFDQYILGKKLTESQKEVAAKHPVVKALQGTYKFQDGDVFVVAAAKTDIILGIYKEKEGATRQEVKTMVGDLMMRFEEPTVMAHDKMIYWTFDKGGKVSGDMFEAAKETGGLETLVTVKFSSTEPIFREPKEKDEKENETKEETMADIYVMITSDPLSSLFLAGN